MVIDYKGVTFSFKAKRRRQLLKRIRLITVIVLLFCLYLIARNFLDTGKIKTVQGLLLENKAAEAAEKFKALEGSFFHRGAKKELKALLQLAAGDRASVENARAALESLDSPNSPVDYQKFLDYFSDHAQYRELKIYTAYLLRVKRLPDEAGLLFYKAMFNAAMLDFNGSLTAMGQMPPAEREKHKQELSIIDKIDNEMKVGKIDYIFDMNGKPMAYYDLRKGKTVSLTPGMFFDEFDVFNAGGKIEENLRFFCFTIDRALQEKIHFLFKSGNYRGSFLLINLNDGSIAAAYSNSLGDEGRREGARENAVFSELYEPGSIIKLLTLFGHLQSGGRDIFPFQCSGSFTLNKNIFYDWIKHNLVKDYEEALVVSCNLCFARMGIQVGAKRLTDIFKSFYFNTGNRAGLKDRCFDFKTGVFKEPGDGEYPLANLSVGLGDITVTTFHTALISAIIAQNGVIYAPHLIKNEKNLLNLAYYHHPAELLTVATDTAIFAKIKNAMIRVVEDKNGTGARSKVDFVRVGLKTGTSGKKEQGLDAILSGFFPAEKPQYAFGFRLQGVGKAEVKGAMFLKDFLISFYGRK
ncbi:MAG: penicillin-binding transpeptidase domain-containing protein [Candidatus Aminicenantes bacterium]|nr:penicillin-binding transpeptidase domain-containing protein [Candidatus Aminicenantes bacterium]